LASQFLNNLIFGNNEINFFLSGGDLFHLISAPFINTFGTLASAVWSATEVFGATFDFGWGVMGDFFGSLADAYGHASQGDFAAALDDLINFGAGVLDRIKTLGTALMEILFPVALDLDGDGVELVSVESGVVIDADGDGVADRSGWVAADDGILAFDLDGDGAVTGLDEIRFADAAAGFDTDLEGLARHDSNQDGVLDAQDADFDRFLIWQDLDQDGVCDAGEARTLEHAGVAAIRLALNNAASLQAGNNVYNTTSWIDANGVERDAWDVGFRAGLHVAQSRDFDWGVITGGADGFFVEGNGQVIDLSAFLQSALNRAWDDGGGWFLT